MATARQNGPHGPKRVRRSRARSAAEPHVRHWIVDYRIRRNKHELDSTGYVEIGPGKYSGEHWQDGFLFVWEDAFGLAEGIVMKHFPAYDSLSMNDIPSAVGRKVAAEWREVAARLDGMKPVEVSTALNLPPSSQDLNAEIAERKSDIEAMLRELAEGLDGFCDHEDWVCILGM